MSCPPPRETVSAAPGSDNVSLAVRVRRLDDKSVVHEVDVTGLVGTSNYVRCLEGLIRKVDAERFFIDAVDADAEHDRRIALVNPRATHRGQGTYP